MDAKTCPGCGEQKQITAFNWKNQELGIRQVRCRTCTREQCRSHYERHRAKYLRKARKRNVVVHHEQRDQVLAYLAAHPCVDCGEADIVCLEFDHVRGRKRGNIASMLGDHAWATIEAEIAKCDVRCANCHRRKTAHAREWYRAKEFVT